MNVNILFYDENNKLFYKKTWEINALAIIAESRDEKRKQIIEQGNVDDAMHAVTMYAKKLFESIKNDEIENHIDLNVFNLMLMLWLVEYTYFSLKTEKFAKADYFIEIFNNGAIKHSRID